MVPLAIAGAFVALQIAATASGQYGYFIDELYYISCAKRLAWGYVDHPPLSIAVLAGIRAVFGNSIVAIRISAIAAVAAAIVAAGSLARRFGGGRFAQALASTCTATSPIALIVGSFYSMNALELLFWPLVAVALVETIRREDPRGWLVIGVLFGLGIENKHTMVLLGAALAVGIAATSLRAELCTRWLWLGVALALALVTPNLLWQLAHGFPSLEFYRNAQAYKNLPTPPLKAIVYQALVAGPGAVFVWPIGVAWLLGAADAKPYRVLGWTFVALFALAILSGSSRPDRIAPMYPVLFAAGGIALERWTEGRGRLVRTVMMLAPLLGGAVVIPLTVPLFSPRFVAAYNRASGLYPQIEKGKTSPLPQLLADRTGWEAFVDDVERVYRALPPEDRAHALIWCPAYGQASAVDLFGPSRGLPPVVSPHNNWWLWGPKPADVLIAAGADLGYLEASFADVHLATTHHCDYCMS
jgi:4-amino-4-deoxy-L-arabinose transferase-like glycosyltransferase